MIVEFWDQRCPPVVDIERMRSELIADGIDIDALVEKIMIMIEAEK
jgi:hypothetical protein